MNIETVALSKLVCDPANARKHDVKNIESIKGSLAKFGQQKPIVVDGNNIVVAGNGTLEAARALGWNDLSIVRTELTGPEAIAFALADNRTSELAEWDTDILSSALQSLKDIDFDIGAIGFDDSFLKVEPAEGLTDDDAVPENVETRCKPGDLWILGNHRLLCGDSTNVQHVERLMGGEKADMVFTDPPYGINYRSSWKNSVSKSGIVGDDQYITDWMSPEIKSGYAFCRFDSYSILEKSITENGLLIFNCLVWDKQSHTAGDLGSWANTHEFLVYFGHNKSTIKREQNVLRFRRLDHGAIGTGAGDDMKHPMQKPIELIEFVFSCEKKGSVLDPFLGSGSTLIACEKTNRRCFGMEIDPRYCDVILKRWEEYTGKQAVMAPGETP